MPAVRDDVNWAEVEQLYRTTNLSNVKLAKMFKVAEATIRSRAEKYGWKKDLSAAERQRTRELLQSGEVTVDANGHNLVEQHAIELAARTNVEVIRSHRAFLKEGYDVSVKMLRELALETDLLSDLEGLVGFIHEPSGDKEADAKKLEKARRQIERVLSLGSRAAVLREISTSAKTWITLERQAFNIPDETKPEETKIILSGDELLEAMQKDAAKVGLEIRKKEETVN